MPNYSPEELQTAAVVISKWWVDEAGVSPESPDEGDEQLAAALLSTVLPDHDRQLRDLLWQAREALRLTREYVGEHQLPAVEGWSWFDAVTAIDAALGVEVEQEADQ